MEITLNGKSKTIQSTQTLYELAESYQLDMTVTAIDLNGDIIPSKDWNKKEIKENDTIEIITFVGGG